MNLTKEERGIAIYLIKFALADSHSPPMMTGDEMVDTLGLLWVVTDRRIPRAGLVSEELTIYYGDNYDREGYERGYWAQAPSRTRAPNAKDMAHIVRKYCTTHGMDYSTLVTAYGV